MFPVCPTAQPRLTIVMDAFVLPFIFAFPAASPAIAILREVPQLAVVISPVPLKSVPFIFLAVDN